VLDVQSDILEPLNTRIVVPLMPLATAPTPARRLNPTFEIEGASYVMVTQFMSAVSLAELRKPAANLGAHF
jgi:toxin CcdB